MTQRLLEGHKILFPNYQCFMLGFEPFVIFEGKRYKGTGASRLARIGGLLMQSGFDGVERYSFIPMTASRTRGLLAINS